MRMIDKDALLAEITKDGEPEVWGADEYAQGRLDQYRMDVAAIKAAPIVNNWISVKDIKPVETHSIFWRFHGTEKWSSAMWKEQSDKVLVTVAFKDGTKLVTTGETHDGVWNTTISRTLEPEVTHWKPMPEPAKEKNDEAD